ncbi:MAG: DUF4038 domain-containing protein, partial [Akkermansiaceae bacterium]|nr:DUF4038 domain-containing protein [Verrucomicrobiales bacterium]
MRKLNLLASVAVAALLLQSTAYSATTLRPSANGRHIQWSDGTPIFLLSDTCWMLPPAYSSTEVANHAATRKSQGFVALQMSAVMASLHPITQAFTSGDFARPVGSYWTMVDNKVKQITDAGLIVIINP